MAINQWINVSLNLNMANIVDNASEPNTGLLGTADGGDVTLAFDSAKVPNLTTLKSAVITALAVAASMMPN